MNEQIVRHRTLPEAYHNSLIKLLEFGVDTECPDWNTTQREIAQMVRELKGRGGK